MVTSSSSESVEKPIRIYADVQLSYDSDASDPYPECCQTDGIIRTSKSSDSDEINKDSIVNDSFLYQGLQKKKEKSMFERVLRKTIFAKMFKGAKRRMLRKYSSNYLMS